MAIGDEIEVRGHVVGFREEIQKAKEKSKDDFFVWFNDAKNADASFVKGAWDFSKHIASEAVGYVSEPEKKAVLEIGHGGGRLLLAASRYFQKAYGVDIHEENDFVGQELVARGARNIELLKSTDGRSIPLGNESVDFVYSFIVLQHVEKIDVFKCYLEDIYRVLKKNGVAILYFGRHCLLSYNRSSRLLCVLDGTMEPLFLPKGFKEKKSRVNQVNLIVSSRFASRLCRRLGFRVMKKLISRRRQERERVTFGGQKGLVLIKR